MNRYFGNLFIVAAPSGAGKTSLVQAVMQSLDEIEVSVSHTTRPPRPAEQEGKDYFFVDETQFLAMVHDNAFIEYAKVFDYYYGTSIGQIQNRLESGLDIILDIDWQGAQHIRKIFPSAISVFILPPSLAILKQRLFHRGQDKEEVIQARMQQVHDELSHYVEFDYLILNDHFQRATEELHAVIVANRVSAARQRIQLEKLLSFLLSSPYNNHKS